VSDPTKAFNLAAHEPSMDNEQGAERDRNDSPKAESYDLTA
jgi:hypothetical protein